MFEKVKRFAKKIATSKKTQMTCLMMVCGVTALMAQTTAGDYSAGTAALTQVSEENTFWLNHTQIKYDKMNIRLKKTRYK